jgi:antitoxin YefM
MKITTYSSFRMHVEEYIGKILTNHSVLCVTIRKGKDVVVMSKQDYDGIMETFYLLRSSKNAARILHALEEYDKMQKNILIFLRTNKIKMLHLSLFTIHCQENRCPLKKSSTFILFLPSS